MDIQDLNKILHGFGDYEPPRCVKCGEDLSNKKHYVGSGTGKWLCERDMQVYHAKNGTKVVGTKAEAIHEYLRTIDSKGMLKF